MKKVFAWLLVLVMLLSLAACGKDNTPSNNTGSNVGDNQNGTTGKDEGSNAGSTTAATEGSSSASDYTAAVENLIQVKYNGKSDNLEAMAPESFWKFYESSGMPRDSLINEAKYAVEYMPENLKYAYGEGYTVSHEITSASELTGETFDKVKAAFAEQKGVDNISAIYVLNIAANFSGTIPGREDFEISAAKIDDSWYFIEWYVWDEGCYGTFFIETMVAG